MSVRAWLRYQVDAALTPGVTAGDAPQAQPASPESAMFFYGFPGVMRATGIETAITPQQGAEE